MIYLTKDSSGCYKSRMENIVVSDSLSYFKARKLFFEKKVEGTNFEIVIQKKSYFNLFLDFQEYKNIKVEEVKEIQEIPAEPKDYFGSADNIFKILLMSRDIDNEILKKMKNKILNSYLEDFPQCVKKDFLEMHPDKVLSKLLNSYIFAKYKEYNFNSIMGTEYGVGYNFFKNNGKLDSNFIELQSQLKEYIDKANLLLIENKLKLSPFFEFNKNRFLKEVSGILIYEKEFYMKSLIEEMNIIRNFTELENSLKDCQEKFGENLDDISLLINDLKIIFEKNNEELNSVDKWNEYYKEKYIRYNSFLDTNIEGNIKNIEKKYSVDLNELKKSIKNIWRNIRRDFELFYLENYNDIQSSSQRKSLEYVLQDNKMYLGEKRKTLLIFIDCLRYDIWLKVKESIEKQGFYCQKEESVYSPIPTVTAYCKKILYHGKKYNQIENSNNLMGLKEIFFGKNLIKIETADEISNQIENGDLFLYEILDLDYFFHNIKDLDLGMIENAISTKLNKIFSELNKDEFNIVVMTDHGAIKLHNSNLKSINFKEFCNENSLEIENHGRYLKIYSKHYNHETYNKLKNIFKGEGKKHYFETENFYLVGREDMGKFYLPVVESSRENYFYIIYRDEFYPKNTGEYNHGGISPEEVIIPFAIFNTEIKKYKEIDIEIKNNILEKGKTSELKILFKNYNELKNLKIKLKYQEAEESFAEIIGNKIVQIPLVCDRVGEIPDVLEITFEYMEERKEYKFPIILIIKENKVQEFNKKLKNSRSLL